MIAQIPLCALSDRLYRGPMPCQLAALCFDANDPARLSRFWAAFLSGQLSDGGQVSDEGDAITLHLHQDPGFALRFRPTTVLKTVPNQIHFDLTSTSLENQQQTVRKALSLGARHIDVGQRPEEGHIVLADPEGNEFCVIPPGNAFLAGCGFIGALACDGSQQVGYFWSEVLGWPLVWDQDQETAIQSPNGGTKISWGGPPLAPKAAVNRLQLELAVPVGEERQAEVDRLLALGATWVDDQPDQPDRIRLADPDGNRFALGSAESSGPW